LTYFERLSVKRDFSVVKCFPITGRTHQIRVHMLKLKHPILGDYQYGENFLNKFFIPRLMLHSLEVEFIHPILKKDLKVKSEIPSSFKGFL
jgi:23S rRNA-/tRNA-specific pseudouridylate synthase